MREARVSGDQGCAATLDVRLGVVRAFAAGTGAHLLVAAVAWVVLHRRYGDGVDGLGYHYGAWLAPTGLALVGAGGLALAWLLTHGRRRSGVGLLLGTGVAAMLEAAWTLVYFLSEGS